MINRPRNPVMINGKIQTGLMTWTKDTFVYNQFTLPKNILLKRIVLGITGDLSGSVMVFGYLHHISSNVMYADYPIFTRFAEAKDLTAFHKYDFWEVNLEGGVRIADGKLTIVTFTNQNGLSNVSCSFIFDQLNHLA